MTLMLFTPLPDGLFLIETPEESNFESWRLRYTGIPAKMEQILADIRSDADESPKTKKEYEHACAVARSLPVCEPPIPDIDYSGVAVASLHTIVYENLARFGKPNGIIDGVAPPIPFNCSRAAATPSKDGAVGTIMWANKDEKAFVAFCHSRTQGFKAMELIQHLKPADRAKSRKELKRGNLPESSPRPMVMFSGIGAQFVCHYGIIVEHFER